MFLLSWKGELGILAMFLVALLNKISLYRWNWYVRGHQPQVSQSEKVTQVQDISGGYAYHSGDGQTVMFESLGLSGLSAI